ncbi:hypothetical protein LCGC14_1739590 [marine sediment metagenome]|uniref:Uncharacterized protein n=1 Tax=marine sediment metagenome TaxID=412755 RepID=A0A0F9H761_9ZZZZ
MTAQDLSFKELQICALLYSTKNSVLFELQVFMYVTNGLSGSIIHDKWVENIFNGTWYNKPFCTIHYDVILRLQSQRLIRRCEEHNTVFYILDIRKENEKFFDELKVQIAIGSI